MIATKTWITGGIFLTVSEMDTWLPLKVGVISAFHRLRRGNIGGSTIKTAKGERKSMRGLKVTLMEFWWHRKMEWQIIP